MSDSVETSAAPADTPPAAMPRAGSSPNGWSVAVLAVAITALAANAFLTSPAKFGDRPWPSGAAAALLKHIVEAMALYFAFPTATGVEVRNLVFSLGAAVLTLIAGLFVMLGRGRGDPDAMRPAELDLDALARTPVGWWILLLVASVLSGVFSHAASIAWGGVAIRVMWLAWWWPLAALLTPTHARRLVAAAVTILAADAALGVWYQFVRAADPAGRLSFPFGNEGWLAACLLPAVVISLSWGLLGSNERPFVARLLGVGAAALTGFALHLTGTRSSLVGLGAAAVAVVYLLLRRTGRRVLLFVLLAGLLAGTWQLRRHGADAVFGQRGASVRSRLEHEWPIALRLISAKPILGHGEGGYTMLGGQFARDRQLDEPAVTAIDRTIDGAIRRIWPDHAHNEYLELATDLGIVGVIAFVAAIVVTLRAAARHVDSNRAGQRLRRDGTVIGLAAALVGMASEAAFSVALRNPGLPPIFLALWAALWAIVRPRRVEGTIVETPARRFRLVGVLLIALAAALGWIGAADWRASLARYRADAALAAGRPADALAPADLADAHQLDPFRHLLAALNAGRARAELFLQLMARSDPLDERDLDIGRDALRLIDRLKRAAPRFLWTSRLEADTARGLEIASERLQRPGDVRHYRQVALNARAQQCRDEPFDMRTIATFLQYAPNTPTRDVLWLLATALREGPMDDAWERYFGELARRPDFASELQQFRASAEQDAVAPPNRWQVSISPEAFRVVARAQFLAGDRDLAARSAAQAATMYERAGARLAGAHAAALLEEAQYRFADQPADPAAVLPLLDRAEALRLSITLLSDLRDRVGRFRSMVLLAAGQEPAVRLRYCGGLEATECDRRIGEASARLARFLLSYSPTADRVVILEFARRGTELWPDEPTVWLILAQAAQEAGRVADAVAAATEFRKIMPNKTLANEMVSRVLLPPIANSPSTQDSADDGVEGDAHPAPGADNSHNSFPENE